MEEQKIKEDKILGDYYTHESYGMLSFSRAQGGNNALFGSSIKHNNVIIMEVNTAERIRGLASDHHFARKPILEAYMSPTQFADCITGMNVGSGSPITIRHMRDGDLKKMDNCPFVSQHEQFRDEFKDAMKELSSCVDPVIEEANRRKLPKAFIKELELLKGRVQSHLPFVNDQFTRQMNNTVKEAKGEVEAFVQTTVTNYGLETIKNMMPQLEVGAEGES